MVTALMSRSELVGSAQDKAVKVRWTSPNGSRHPGALLSSHVSLSPHLSLPQGQGEVPPVPPLSMAGCHVRLHFVSAIFTSGVCSLQSMSLLGLGRMQYGSKCESCKYVGSMHPQTCPLRSSHCPQLTTNNMLFSKRKGPA